MAVNNKGGNADNNAAKKQKPGVENNNNLKRNENERGNNNKNNNNNKRNDNNNENRVDDSKENAELQKAKKQVEALINKSKAYTEEITAKGNLIKQCREEITRLQNSRVNFGDKKSELRRKIKIHMDTIAENNMKVKVAKEKKSDLKDSLAVKPSGAVEVTVARNLYHLDQRIKALEEELHMDNMDGGEVKRKTVKLEKEKAKRNAVFAFNQISIEIKTMNEFNNQLFEDAKNLREVLVNLENQEKAYSTLITEQFEKINNITAEINKIKEQRKKNNDEIEEAKDVQKKKKQILDKLWEDWKAQQSELRKQRQEQEKLRRQQFEQQRKEREESNVKRQEAAEEKKNKYENSLPPYHAEVKNCEFLIKYLKDLKVNKQKDAPLKATPLDVVIRYEGLSLEAPGKTTEVEASLKAIEEKKAYFLELRETVAQKNVVVAEEKKEESAQAPAVEEKVEENNNNNQVEAVASE